MRYVKYSNARIKICLQDFSLRFTICAQCILIWKTTKKTFVIDAIELVFSKLKPAWRAIVGLMMLLLLLLLLQWSWRLKKSKSPPAPSEYGTWPFHLLIPCHCRYCGFWRSCSLIILMACDSPLALAIFALACASACRTVWFAITCMALKLFCSVRYFWNATTFCSI